MAYNSVIAETSSYSYYVNATLTTALVFMAVVDIFIHEILTVSVILSSKCLVS